MFPAYFHADDAMISSTKKMLLKISRNSLENTCASLFFTKIVGLSLQPINKENTAQVFFLCIL